MNASVFDTKGTRLTQNNVWANPLCPEIKSNEKGQQFICSLAHQNLTAQAKETGKPVVDECDAGLVKVVVPIFVADEFVGVAGGCGLISKTGEADTFLVSRTTGIDESELEPLAENLSVITDEKLDKLVTYITEQIVLLKIQNVA